ncbi:MAG: hypothetical protein DMG64_03750 [Acidobacteria bacterium]|nr:MAG: hypothetical protein DMG64_03750 [Acidobacteriota bacterium]PYY24508.1 MAG: hypothetical protein DMG62_02775 [Acidobacteriota bacterium]
MDKAAFSRIGRCFVVGIALTLLIGTASSTHGFSALGALLAPGMLIAALVFQGGIHSNWPNAYLIMAGVAEALIFAWLVWWLWKLIDGRAKR